MTTPTSPISLSNIQSEFAGSNPISLSEYYRGGQTGYVQTNQPKSPVSGEVLISTSGLIRIGMFRNLGGVTGSFVGSTFNVTKTPSAPSITVTFNPDGTITFDGTQSPSVPRWFSNATGSSYIFNFSNYQNGGSFGTGTNLTTPQQMSQPIIFNFSGTLNSYSYWQVSWTTQSGGPALGGFNFGMNIAADTTTELLHFNSAPATTSTRGHTFTAATRGDNTTTTPTISTSVSKFGGGSLATAGNNYIRTAGSSDWALSTSFTIEFWVYFTSLPPSSNFHTMAGNWLFPNYCWYFDIRNNGGTNRMTFVFTTDGTTNTQYELINTTAIAINTWYHVAAVRSTTSMRFYVNGSGTASSNFGSTPIWSNAATPMEIGALGIYYDRTMVGYLDEFRYSKDTAQYAVNATITPPTAAFT